MDVNQTEQAEPIDLDAFSLSSRMSGISDFDINDLPLNFMGHPTAGIAVKDRRGSDGMQEDDSQMDDDADDISEVTSVYTPPVLTRGFGIPPSNVLPHRVIAVEVREMGEEDDISAITQDHQGFPAQQPPRVKVVYRPAPAEPVKVGRYKTEPLVPPGYTTLQRTDQYGGKFWQPWAPFHIMYPYGKETRVNGRTVIVL